MGLTMSQQQAVTKTIAARDKRAGRVEKGMTLDELCATTGWRRNHARKALGHQSPRNSLYLSHVLAG